MYNMNNFIETLSECMYAYMYLYNKFQANGYSRALIRTFCLKYLTFLISELCTFSEYLHSKN